MCVGEEDDLFTRFTDLNIRNQETLAVNASLRAQQNDNIENIEFKLLLKDKEIELMKSHISELLSQNHKIIEQLTALEAEVEEYSELFAGAGDNKAPVSLQVSDCQAKYVYMCSFVCVYV